MPEFSRRAFLAASAGAALPAVAATPDGVVDVTRSPYSADPSGKRDSTSAIQKAIDDARDGRMIVFFPAGRYRVSAPLIANQQNPKKSDHPLLKRRDEFPCILWGGAAGGRATLVLADNAPGFGDAANPQPVVYFISLLPDGSPDNPNISFNQMIVSLDVELGRGNPGAIGVDQQGAQGSVAEDVNVVADGAFAGFRGACGSGGSMSHLTVRGGRFGLYLAGLGRLKQFSGAQPAPVISNLTLTGQTETSILCATRGPLTLAGASIDGPGIRLQSTWGDFNGALNLVDSVIRRRGSGPAIGGNRPVYLENVWVENAAEIARLGDAPVLEGSSHGWTHVAEYAASPTPAFPVWVNGAKQAQPVVSVRRSGAPPAGFRDAHKWREPLPSWNSPGVANVRHAPYSAAGDGATDDTAALQQAIDASRDVFLPKGIYRISRPLRLRSDTRLFGIGVHSKIEPAPDAPAFADPAKPSPMIVTPDDAKATCTAAFFQLWCRIPGAFAIHWRAGRNSMVRNVRTKSTPWPKDARPASHPVIVIDGNGGGRWYNTLTHIRFPQIKEHLHVLVRGTREPLAFYMLNPEHSNADYMIGFEDVRRVRIYSVKSETLGANGPRALTPVRIRNSSDFRIYGHGGNACPLAGDPLYRLENCSGFVLTNFGYQSGLKQAADAKTWFMVEDRAPGGKVTRTPATETFALYKR